MFLRPFKLIFIFAGFIAYWFAASVLHIVVSLKPSLRWKAMNRLTQFLMRVLCRVLGIQLKVYGAKETLEEKGNFIISRHVSYTDGIILGGLTPAILVSKKEVKRWPLFGQVVSIAGTVFVDRLNKYKVSDHLKQMVRLLKNKVNVIVFPEGTSSNGAEMKPFQTPFFQVPLISRAAVVPVTIVYRYLDDNLITPSNRDDIFWYGQVKFFDHLWNLLRFRKIEADVIVHEKIEAGVLGDNSAERKKLSQACYDFMKDVSFASEKSEARHAACV